MPGQACSLPEETRTLTNSDSKEVTSNYGKNNAKRALGLEKVGMKQHLLISIYVIKISIVFRFILHCSCLLKCPYAPYVIEMHGCDQ